MNRPLILVSIFITLTSQLTAGIYAWLPDTLACRNTELKLPIYVASIRTADSIVAYQCEIEYDSHYMTLLNVDEQNSMVSSWGNPTINSLPGKCIIAGFTSNASGQQLIDTTQTWLYLNFWIESDTSCTAEINLTVFQVFPLFGQIETDSTGDAKVGIVVNYPPEIPFLPGINILEDDTVTYNLIDYVHDKNDAWEDLKITIDPDPNVVIHLDASGLMKIEPQSDWFGQTIITLHVTDPLGAQVSGQIICHVISVADLPTDFSLISPENDTMFSSFDQLLRFQWQTSYDADEGDKVEYSFYLSPDSLFRSEEALYIPNLDEPEISINQNFHPGDYYWTVIAIDQDGLKKASQDTFKFHIELPSKANSDPKPCSFELAQNYPNPFNSSTVLDFELDRFVDTTLDILNVKGEHVRRLICQRLEAGPHTVQWHGLDDQGVQVPSGFYWAILRTSRKSKAIKICVLK